MPTRYLNVRLTEQEYNQLDQIVRFGGYRSLQQAAHQAVVGFISRREGKTPQAFLDLASRFYEVAPKDTREFVRESMQMVLESRRRRRKT